MIKNAVIIGVGAMLLGAATFAQADEHIVQAVVTQWRPMVTFAKPGDTIRFTGMAGHDTQTIEGMIPEGATTWQSKLGEEGFVATVDEEGAWIFKCNPHMTTGMVGVVVVGDARPPANRARPGPATDPARSSSSATRRSSTGGRSGSSGT